MKPVVVPFPGQESLGTSLARALDAGGDRVSVVSVALRDFPDGESHVRLSGDVRGRDVVVACTLDRPNPRLVPLALIARAASDSGARRVLLVAPYLAYMRQDAVFSPGEGLSSCAFGALLSSAFDGLCTMDPHLHRHASLDEVLTIPSRVVTAAAPMAAWIVRESADAVIVAPDEEAEQWARAVAEAARRPLVVLRKLRRGDRDVSIDATTALPSGQPMPSGQPVIVDDILSTGGTLVEVVRTLRSMGAPKPIAVVVHAVLASDPRESLREAGLERLVTCNSIAHETNAIDIVPELARGVTELLEDISS